MTKRARDALICAVFTVAGLAMFSVVFWLGFWDNPLVIVLFCLWTTGMASAAWDLWKASIDDKLRG